MANSYTSHQDFHTQLAKMTATSLYVHELLPRTLAHDSQNSFEEYLHEAMGWKTSTVDDWQF